MNIWANYKEIKKVLHQFNKIQSAPCRKYIPYDFILIFKEREIDMTIAFKLIYTTFFFSKYQYTAKGRILLIKIWGKINLSSIVPSPSPYLFFLCF